MVRKHTISVQNAYRGLKSAFASQPNFKVHSFFSLLALGGAWVFKITYFELLIIIILICVGFVIEMVNTALEATNDAISAHWSPAIKHAKDTAAGAMLIFAIGAVVISGVIFIPRIFIFLGL